MTTAIICGGRGYTDAARITKVLDAAVERLGLHTIIEGESGEEDADGNVICGADKLARAWAMARPDISVIACPVSPEEWEAYGKAAGPRRNKMMAKMLLAAEGNRMVFAFPGGAGTASMIEISRKIGIEPVRLT